MKYFKIILIVTLTFYLIPAYSQEEEKLTLKDVVHAYKIDFESCNGTDVKEIKSHLNFPSQLELLDDYTVRQNPNVAQFTYFNSYWKFSEDIGVLDLFFISKKERIMVSLRKDKDVLRGTIFFNGKDNKRQHCKVVFTPTVLDDNGKLLTEILIKDMVDDFKNYKLSLPSNKRLCSFLPSAYINVSQLPKNQQKLYYGAYVTGFLDALMAQESAYVDRELRSKIETFLKDFNQVKIDSLVEQIIDFYEKYPEYRLLSATDFLLTVLPRVIDDQQPFPSTLPLETESEQGRKQD